MNQYLPNKATIEGVLAVEDYVGGFHKEYFIEEHPRAGIDLNVKSALSLSSLVGKKVKITVEVID